jgi:hypothetical protein
MIGQVVSCTLKGGHKQKMNVRKAMEGQLNMQMPLTMVGNNHKHIVKWRVIWWAMVDKGLSKWLPWQVLTTKWMIMTSPLDYGDYSIKETLTHKIKCTNERD